MSEIKLKPCLWCGAEAKICNSPLGYFVECDPLGHLHNSGVFNDEFYKNPQEAAEDWNRRKGVRRNGENNVIHKRSYY